MLDLEQKQLLKDMEDMNNNMEENLSRQKAIMQTNWESKMQTAIQEQVARARLEWLKEKTQGQTDDLVHVEKSLSNCCLLSYNPCSPDFFVHFKTSCRVYVMPWTPCVTKGIFCRTS